MTAEALIPSDSWLARLIVLVGSHVMPNSLRGCLRLTLPSGREVIIGQPGSGVEADLQFLDFRVVLRAIRRASVGFGEGYVAGEWSSTDPARLLLFYLQNRPQLDRAAGPFFFRSLFARMRHMANGNTRPGARRNIAAHYDLGNDFYRLWLDSGLTYSSGLFFSTTEGLEAAQAAKYDFVLDALKLEPEQHILEIGCGWGGFADAAVSRGARVTGITLSREQFDYCKERLGSSAEFRLEDYRDVSGRFDRIASIEMIEAVGEANWPLFFDVLHQRLKPGGIAVLQAITIDEGLFDRYRRSADFVQLYVFPGGMLPTVSILAREARRAGFGFERMLQFGPGYAKTLKIWRERFEDQWPKISALGFDERFRRMWTYYLAYCEAGFAGGTIDVGVYRLTRSV